MFSKLCLSKMTSDNRQGLTVSTGINTEKKNTPKKQRKRTPHKLYVFSAKYIEVCITMYLQLF